MESGIRKMGIVKWRQVAQDGNGYRDLGRRLSFLESTATKEEEEEGRKKERKKERKRRRKNGVRKMGIVNWRQVALDRNGYRDRLGRRLSFLESRATKEEEEEKKEETP